MEYPFPLLKNITPISMSHVFSLLPWPLKLRRKARRSRIATMLILPSILIAPFYMTYKPPAYLLRYFQWRWPDVLWRISTSSKVIALTIDDGPSHYTNEILDILKSNGATATFFIIGSQVEGQEKTLQDLIRNGNELGNHAMHDEPSRLLTDATLVDQIHTVEGMIDEAYTAVDAEPPPKYFRPGSACCSLERSSSAMIEGAGRHLCYEKCFLRFGVEAIALPPSQSCWGKQGHEVLAFFLLFVKRGTFYTARLVH